jgi:hypothetical protein
MPNFPWSARGDVPPAGDAAFEALLAGKLPPEDAAVGLRPLADAIAALAAPPMRSEITAEPSARATYRAGFAGLARTAPLPRHRHRHRRAAFASLVSVRLAAASVVILAILAAAAYTGMLPAPVQRLAHSTLGAPAPHPTAHVVPSATPGGSSRLVPAAYGLCTAYSRAREHGQINPRSGFFRKLARMAGGPAKIPAYCAGVAHPGNGPPAKAGKTPPGQVGKTPPDHAGQTPPGQVGNTPPGHGGKTPPGQVGNTPPGR